MDLLLDDPNHGTLRSVRSTAATAATTVEDEEVEQLLVGSVGDGEGIMGDHHPGGSSSHHPTALRSSCSSIATSRAVSTVSQGGEITTETSMDEQQNNKNNNVGFSTGTHLVVMEGEDITALPIPSHTTKTTTNTPTSATVTNTSLTTTTTTPATAATTTTTSDLLSELDSEVQVRCVPEIDDDDDDDEDDDRDDKEEDEEDEYEYEDDDAAYCSSGFIDNPILVQPHDDETAAAAAAAACVISPSTTKTQKPPPVRILEDEWREPSRAAVHMSVRAESETTGGKRRLAQDLYRIMTQQNNPRVHPHHKTKKHNKNNNSGGGGTAGFRLEPLEEDMAKWRIRVFEFDADSMLAKDMLVLNLDSIELEMNFPEQYPFEPPFVRVVRPRFKKQTGFVMNGAICMELLTQDGWNPVNDIESVIVSIRSLLVVGNGRLEAAADLSPKVYEARLLAGQEAARLRLLEEEEEEEERIEDDEEEEEEDEVDKQSSHGRNGNGNGNGDANATSHNSKRLRTNAAGDSVVGMGALSKSRPHHHHHHHHPHKPGVNVNHMKNAASSNNELDVGTYSVAEAQAAYSHLSSYHQKKGWDSSGWWARKG